MEQKNIPDKLEEIGSKVVKVVENNIPKVEKGINNLLSTISDKLSNLLSK